MVSDKNKQYGFSISAVLLPVLIVATLAVTSLVIYQKSSAATVPSQTTTKPGTVSPAQAAYSNAAHGLSYSYPTDWTPSGDVTNDPKTSATRQEFGTGIKLGAAASCRNLVRSVLRSDANKGQ